jgi:hypothetical protein
VHTDETKWGNIAARQQCCPYIALIEECCPDIVVAEESYPVLF